MKESVVLAQAKHYLTLLQHQGKLTFRRIHVMPILRGRGKHQVFSRNKEMEGMEDLQIWVPGKFLAVELKSDSGKQRPGQALRQGQLERLGHPYIITRCLDDLIAKLEEYGIVNPFRKRPHQPPPPDHFF